MCLPCPANYYFNVTITELNPENEEVDPEQETKQGVPDTWEETLTTTETAEAQAEPTKGLSASLEGQAENPAREHHHEKPSPLPKSWVPWTKGVARKKLTKRVDLAKVSEANTPTKPIAATTPRPTKELEVQVYGGMRLAQLESTIDPELRNQINVIQKKQYRQFEVGESLFLNLGRDMADPLDTDIGNLLR